MDATFGHPWSVLLAASVLAVLAVGRAARLLVEDDFPPAAWLRGRWIAATNGTGWDTLAVCTFCATPWLAAADLAWAWASGLHWSWWAANAWGALSYAAAIVAARDTPPSKQP